MNKPHKFQIWLAALACAFSALSPVISHAVKANCGRSIAYMSSFVGINTMPTHEQTTTDNLKPSRHCDKCKCDCPFGGAAAVMVPRAATKLPVFVVAGTVRLSDSTVAFASAIRNHALARGPPQFS